MALWKIASSSNPGALVELLRVLDRERVEPEDVAQDLEVVLARALEVEPEEAAAREELRHPLAGELDFAAVSLLDDVASPDSLSHHDLI